MSKASDRLESGFQSLGRAICRRARWVVVLGALVVGGLAAPGARIVMDTSPEGMLHADDPVRMDYDRFRQEFDGDAAIVVGVQAPATFDDAFLGRLEALHADLESSVPYLEEVTSLVDARYTRGDDETFVVGDLMADWEAAGGDAASLQGFARVHPLYRDNFVSSEGGWVAIVLETQATVAGEPTEGAAPSMDFEGSLGFEAPSPSAPRYFSPKERAEVVDALNVVVARHERAGLTMVLAGGPVIVDAFDRATVSDTTRCVVASLIGIVLVLWVFFRRLSAVFLPNLVVGGSVSVAFGMMGLTGAPFTLATSGVFAILIAVGTCSVVHLLTIFYRHLGAGTDRDAAAVFALGHAGPAIVMTSLTTTAGLLSFGGAPLASTAHVGIFSAIGVFAALILTLVWVPAILSVSPLRAGVASAASSHHFDRGLVGLAKVATQRHGVILVGGLAVFLVGLFGTQRVEFAHDPVSYFAEDARVRTDLETIDRELSGGTTLELIVDSGRENGLSDPVLLQRLDRAGHELAARAATEGKEIRIFSLIDVVKETHQALHANALAYYAIPDSAAMLSQELFLFEQSGSTDLSRLVDPGYRKARITIRTPYADGVVYRDFVAEAETVYEAHLDGAASVVATGAMALEARAIPYAIETMTSSYFIAFVVISGMMIVFLRSLRLGLVAMIPNLLPIVSVLGLMGFSGAPLDQTSVVIGSIGLGLVVDDTIHFLYNFQKYHRQSGDVTKAVEQAFLGAGRAMVVTSAVLVAAFWVDLLATLSNVVRFGFFVGLIVMAALVTDFLVAPALMQLLEKSRNRRRRRPLGMAPVSAALAVLLTGAADVSRADDLDAAGAGAAIMQRVYDRDDGEQRTLEIQMSLVDSKGRRRERRARSYGRDRADGGTESVLFFLEPADVRGTGFLTHDFVEPGRPDDQWLFLPALGRTKRVSSNEKSRPFMGSDFSYADMTRRSPDLYDYRLLGEAEIGGHPTWKIEAVPAFESERKETGYRKSLVYVRKDIDVVVRAVHWLADSDKMKMLDVKRIEQIDGIWTPMEVHMSTGRGRQLEHRTVLRNLSVDYVTDVSADGFTTRRLEKGL